MEISGANQVMQSVQALGDIMQQAQAQNLDLAKKMVSMDIQMQVAGLESGKGQNFDCYA